MLKEMLFITIIMNIPFGIMFNLTMVLEQISKQVNPLYYSMDVWELYDMDADPHEMNNIYANTDPGLIIKVKDLSWIL